jgi:hypothetical protein
MPATTTREDCLTEQSGRKDKCDDLLHQSRTFAQALDYHLGLGILAAVFALCAVGCQHSPKPLTAFRTEQQAQEHCPSDTVVWVDPQSGAYYLKKSKSYGQAGTGRYACRGDAEDAGMRAIAN